jgi:hypothetical protein
MLFIESVLVLIVNAARTQGDMERSNTGITKQISSSSELFLTE